MMCLALTYDHRLMDGREAVMFLKKIKQTEEDPCTILLPDLWSAEKRKPLNQAKRFSREWNMTWNLKIWELSLCGAAGFSLLCALQIQKFCPRDMSPEFKSVWIEGTCRGDKTTLHPGYTQGRLNFQLRHRQCGHSSQLINGAVSRHLSGRGDLCRNMLPIRFPTWNEVRLCCLSELLTNFVVILTQGRLVCTVHATCPRDTSENKPIRKRNHVMSLQQDPPCEHFKKPIPASCPFVWTAHEIFPRDRSLQHVPSCEPTLNRPWVNNHSAVGVLRGPSVSRHSIHTQVALYHQSNVRSIFF